MAKVGNHTQFTFWLAPEVYEKLRNLAFTKRTTIATLIREGVEYILKKYEE